MEMNIKDFNNFEKNKNGMEVFNQIHKILNNVEESPAVNSKLFNKKSSL